MQQDADSQSLDLIKLEESTKRCLSCVPFYLAVVVSRDQFLSVGVLWSYQGSSSALRADLQTLSSPRSPLIKGRNDKNWLCTDGNLPCESFSLTKDLLHHRSPGEHGEGVIIHNSTSKMRRGLEVRLGMDWDEK